MQKKTKWYEVRKIQSKSLAEILVYGVIGTEDRDIRSADFVRELRSLEKNYPEIRIRINCYGGDPDEGLPMYNAMVQSSSNIVTVNEGIAASWGAILFQGGRIREMASNARFMTHQAVATVNAAHADELKRIAEDVERINAIMRNIMMKRTGADEKTVRSWFVAGKDRYFDAEECLALNICDRIVEPVAKLSAKWDEHPTKIVAQFTNELKTNLTKTNMEKELLIQALGLQANATDADILAAITSLKNKELSLSAKLQALEAEAKKHQNEKIQHVLAAALSGKKITESQKPMFEALLKADFDNAKAALDSISAVETTGISAQIHAMAHTGAVDVKEKTFAELFKEAPHVLADLERENPAKFKALYKAQYGVEPNLN